MFPYSFTPHAGLSSSTKKEVEQLIEKFLNRLRELLHFLHNVRINLGITPFVQTGELGSGISLFRARIKTPLARKGQLLAIPVDRMIHSYVLNYGQWGKKEADYLTKVLASSLTKYPNDCILVDFGAHAGFVSKQVLDKLKSSRIKALLVDALNSNLSAQEFNLSTHSDRISLINCALSDVSGTTKFLMDMNNVGGSHMKGDSSPTLSEVEYDVQSMTPAEFEMRYLQGEKKLVIKSDIEGWDAYVMY